MSTNRLTVNGWDCSIQKFWFFFKIHGNITYYWALAQFNCKILSVINSISNKNISFNDKEHFFNHFLIMKDNLIIWVHSWLEFFHDWYHKWTILGIFPCKVFAIPTYNEFRVLFIFKETKIGKETTQKSFEQKVFIDIYSDVLW